MANRKNKNKCADRYLQSLDEGQYYLDECFKINSMFIMEVEKVLRRGVEKKEIIPEIIICNENSSVKFAMIHSVHFLFKVVNN